MNDTQKTILPPATGAPVNPTSEPLDAQDIVGYYNSLPVKVNAMIDAYRPQMAPRSWAAIREFVLQAVRDVQPHNATWTRDNLGSVSKFVLWTWQKAGLPLDRKQVFATATIDRYVLTLDGLSNKTTLLHESKLRRLAEALGSDVEPRRIEMNTTFAHPYSDSDLPRLFSWARTAKRPRTRQDSWAILGFCGGAGLRTPELAGLKGRDVELVDGRYFVHVSGKYRRTVPVRRGWESSVRRAIEGVEPESYVAVPHVAHAHRVHVLSSFYSNHTVDAPRCSRLRVTWIVYQVNRLPLGMLLKASGFSTASSLVRYTKIADAPSESELASRMLEVGE